MACVSAAGTWFRTRNQSSSSISVVNGFYGRTRTSSVSANVVSVNNSHSLVSGMLHCSFLSSSSAFSSGSSFSGSSWGMDFSSTNEVRQERGHRLVVRAGRKFQLAQTKRNKSRKSLARTHGFRLRMRTTSGRALLKRRRAKGRKVLCTKTNPSGGKRACA